VECTGARRPDGDAKAPQTAAIERLTDADLPAGDVTVDVEYSSLNSTTASSSPVRDGSCAAWMVPGIDLAGTVVATTLRPRSVTV
jgi:acrylyl-CoA reductase (NADPH)